MTHYLPNLYCVAKCQIHFKLEYCIQYVLSTNRRIKFSINLYNVSFEYSSVNTQSITLNWFQILSSSPSICLSTISLKATQFPQILGVFLTPEQHPSSLLPLIKKIKFLHLLASSLSHLKSQILYPDNKPIQTSYSQ